MYQEFDYDVVREMDSLEDPRSAREVALSLLRVFLVVLLLPQLSAFSAEPRYSGDDVMLGCNEWLVGRGGLLLRPLLKQTRQTGSSTGSDFCFAQLCLFVIVIDARVQIWVLTSLTTTVCGVGDSDSSCRWLGAILSLSSPYY